MKAIAKFGFGFMALAGGIYLFGDFPMQNKYVAQLWGLNQLYYFQFKDKLKARVLPALDKRFSFSTDESFSRVPKVNLPSGFYESPVNVVLSSDENGGTIYYTLDGSIPTTHSFRYREPIHINSTTVLRFRCIESGHLPGDTVNRTYFVNEGVRLQVLSLIADPVVLWNRYSGIYRHPMKRGRRWKRAAHVEYFSETHLHSISFPANLTIHGGYSRENSKKSFRLTYRIGSVEGSQGGNNIVWPNNATSERTIILRQGGDNEKTRLRDELFQTLYADLGGFVSSFTPSVLFVNGRIWGIYNIREHINVEYLKSRRGSGNYDLIKEDRVAVSGGMEHWNHTLEFFRTHDFSNDAEFAKASEIVDIANLTDYWLLNIYAGNSDWPRSNGFSFRRRVGSDTRWRWISWDADHAFDFAGEGLKHNTLAWAIRDRQRHDLAFGKEWGQKDHESKLIGTLIVRSLLKNDGYRKMFIRRFGDLLNYYLVPERVKTMLDEIIEMSRHDLPADWERWSISKNEYWQEVEKIRNFIRKRPQIIREYFQKEFQLGPSRVVRVFNEPPAGGTIQINRIEPEKYPWTGTYFLNEKIVVSARASRGFTFVGWTDPRLGINPEVSLDLKEDLSLGAVYKRGR